jgi:hypothetical protein
VLLAGHLDILRGLVRVILERIHQQFEQERDVIARAGLADPLGEILLLVIDVTWAASGRYQASTLTASPPIRLILATDQSSISLESRPSGVSSNRLSSRVTIKPFGGRQHVDRPGDRIMRVEQHRGALRLQGFDQQPLEARHLLPRRLSPRDAPRSAP